MWTPIDCLCWCPYRVSLTVSIRVDFNFTINLSLIINKIFWSVTRSRPRVNSRVQVLGPPPTICNIYGYIFLLARKFIYGRFRRVSKKGRCLFSLTVYLSLDTRVKSMETIMEEESGPIGLRSVQSPVIRIYTYLYYISYS